MTTILTFIADIIEWIILLITLLSVMALVGILTIWVLDK